MLGHGRANIIPIFSPYVHLSSAAFAACLSSGALSTVITTSSKESTYHICILRYVQQKRKRADRDRCLTNTDTVMDALIGFASSEDKQQPITHGAYIPGGMTIVTVLVESSCIVICMSLHSVSFEHIDGISSAL